MVNYMNDKNYVQSGPVHNIIMENRRMLNISGVLDVESFDERTITLSTQLGGMTVKGLKLHISHLDQQSGEMCIDGEISDIVYSEEEIEPAGFWSRLFR